MSKRQIHKRNSFAKVNLGCYALPMLSQRDRLHTSGLWLGLFFVSAWTPASALAAPLSVVTTVPDLAEVVTRIGGKHVQVQSLLDGREDPHSVAGSPSYVTRIMKADALCVMGFGLEDAWLSKVIERSARKELKPGGAGYCEVGKTVTALGEDKHAGSRHSHNHKGFNPHFNLSPLALAQGSKEIVRVLSGLKPEAKAEFEDRGRVFEKQMRELVDSLKARMAGKRVLPLYEYHEEFAYLLSAYGLKSQGSIEEHPGAHPSPTRLAALAKRMKAEGGLILAARGAPEKPLERLKEATGVGVLRLHTWLQSSDPGLDSIEEQQHHLVGAIIQASEESVRSRMLTR